MYDSLREHPGHRSKNVDEFTGQQFDYVLTVCDNAKESCPIFPSKTMTIHRNFEDPAVVQGSEEERFAVFRRVRDEIRDYLRELTQRSPAIRATLLQAMVPRVVVQCTCGYCHLTIRAEQIGVPIAASVARST